MKPGCSAGICAIREPAHSVRRRRRCQALTRYCGASHSATVDQKLRILNCVNNGGSMRPMAGPTGSSRNARRAAALLLAASFIAASSDAQPTWKLTETLRLGGQETGPEAFLYAKSIEADAKGRILVLDRKTQDIRVFGSDGKLVRVIGRAGSGPGEMRDAEGIVIVRDGNLWVRDAANARFSVFNAEGVYQSAWTMTFCWSQGEWNPQPDRQGRIIDRDCSAGRGPEGKELVVAYRTDKSRVDTLGVRPACGDPELNEKGTWITKTARSTSYRAIPFAARPLTALGPDGAMWCVPNSSKYEVLRLSPTGADTVRIARAASRVPVTSADKDSIIAGLEEKEPSGLDFSRIPKEKPAIDRLTVDDQGRLWVRRTAGNGTLAFDVFGTNGRIVATAAMTGCRTSVWQPFVVRRENVYTVCYDEDDVQFVTRFRVGR